MVSLAHQQNTCMCIICLMGDLLQAFMSNHVFEEKQNSLCADYDRIRIVKQVLVAVCNLACGCFASINWSWHKVRRVEVVLMDEVLEESRHWTEPRIICVTPKLEKLQSIRFIWSLTVLLGKEERGWRYVGTWDLCWTGTADPGSLSGLIFAMTGIVTVS